MPSFNRVVLMGNLTRDVELRMLPNNTAVADIGLAVNERYKSGQTGEWQDRANFFDCTAFGRTAENINRFFSKGKPILLEGKLRWESWEDREGNKRSKVKVVIESFEFVGARDSGGGGGGGGGGGRSQSRSSGNRNNGDDYDGGSSRGHEPIPEDDIPF
ncbi:single-stranded DNA-binding protein [Mucisphaera calidilacus]|uniref:Single-stranded DNA-binding protein n=1 Tax=Mucisphaera calidilacus TaxID=2527982 RepID=A0A518BYT5_9BACT|nr:single-stranded DNA-binding protein [Mucisphaera calidilacus]QDU72139.1 Single-stranded DNA-binding protein [Mucisphaera calidilacus]